MHRTLPAWLTIAGILGWSLPALGADTWTSSAVGFTVETPGEDMEDILRVTLPALPTEGVGVLAQGRLVLNAQLSAGTEIQAWRADSLSTAPWLEADGRSRALVDFWIVDDRTADLSLLDVTRYLWEAANAAEAVSLVIRAVGPDDEPIDLTAETIASAELRVGFQASSSQ